MKTDDYRILIVDDLEKNLQVLGTMLREEGFRTSFASSGEEALRILNEQTDLVLLDVMMPQMDGIEVCRRIRSQANLQEIPVIFLSARSDKASVLEGFNAGANDYITKPFNRKELTTRILSQLRLIKKCKQLQAENSSYRNQLEDLQQQITKQNKEAHSLHKQLNRLDDAKSDFLNLLSRDLRTPLNGILGFVDIVEETLTNDDQKAAVSYLHYSAKRLSRLADTALMITNLRAGQRELKYTYIEIDLLIKQSLYESTALRNEKRVYINKRFSPKNIKLYADEELIVAALTKIVTNAVMASPKAKTINFQAYTENHYTHILVKDFGPGFSQKKLMAIIEAAENDQMLTKAAGVGLGLILAKLVVDAHHGRLIIENANKGAQIRISLPCKSDE